MLILGIDDAGRGPVIGPMIIAGCLIDSGYERELKNLGVKDSKQLTQKRREFLFEKIKEIAIKYEYLVISPEEIDNSIKNNVNLNELEAIKMAEIINKINDNKEKIKVILDCPSVSINKWKDFLKLKIQNLSNLEINAEHKADVNYVEVSAASIIAKCIREEEMNKLKEMYGEEIGSGYPSDPKTCTFIDSNFKKHKDKGIFRKSWSTMKEACTKTKQQKLF
jgi:ribonuclease HII